MIGMVELVTMTKSGMDEIVQVMTEEKGENTRHLQGYNYILILEIDPEATKNWKKAKKQTMTLMTTEIEEKWLKNTEYITLIITVMF